MGGMSRAGFLVVLAACGGGQRAGQADSAAMSSATPPTDTTAMAPASASNDSAMTAPAPAPTADPSATAAAPKQDTSKAAAAAQDTSKKAAAAQDTSKRAAAAKPAAGGGGGGPTPQQVTLGDSIFHGQVAGGTCTACHGQDAKGTAVAPDLTDSKWINGDGSYQFIVNTVTTGVPKPKEHPAPMPPKGGATLTDDQVKAVAAYVYSLSHKI